MKIRSPFIAGGVLAVGFAGYLAGAWAEDKVIEHGQPNLWRWPESMDSVNAAPKNHKVLFENDHVRLLEVTIQPGETENMHGHKFPSVFMMDAPQPKTINKNLEEPGDVNGPRGRGGQRPPPPAVGKVEYPTAHAMTTPQAPHQITVDDKFPQHFYRMEFKKIDGDAIKAMTKYPAE